ncbi:unnamed protein product [Heligmosomoides polygyrus]|uniref:Potassium channel domain-containing protein n=1 Tax=Heligmosomoides polygyrus TaxID=6339 RepID=A0A3P8BLC7_HELPZ|nr:unnamed protein product [Heligmosomoides polygyrus]
MSGKEEQNTIVSFQYAKRILPHVGLVLLLFAYLLVGATIFHAIEGPNELAQRDNELRTIFGLRDDFQDHIWNITQDIDNRISREAFNSINQEYFEQLVKNIFISYRNQFINENHLTNSTKGEGLLWTYPNSIFFATTVITTIDCVDDTIMQSSMYLQHINGYGNLVPTTTSGRVACIIFALFGIPLLLVTIADIGKFLSEFLSFLYKSYRAFKRKHHTAAAACGCTANGYDSNADVEEIDLDRSKQVYDASGNPMSFKGAVKLTMQKPEAKRDSRKAGLGLSEVSEASKKKAPAVVCDPQPRVAVTQRKNVVKEEQSDNRYMLKASANFCGERRAADDESDESCRSVTHRRA